MWLNRSSVGCFAFFGVPKFAKYIEKQSILALNGPTVWDPNLGGPVLACKPGPETLETLIYA